MTNSTRCHKSVGKKDPHQRLWGTFQASSWKLAWWSCICWRLSCIFRLSYSSQNRMFSFAYPRMEKFYATELGYQQFCLFYTLDTRKIGGMFRGIQKGRRVWRLSLKHHYPQGWRQRMQQASIHFNVQAAQIVRYFAERKEHKVWLTKGN